MQVKKIIVKNFINPGKQDFVFDDNGYLKKGNFYSLDQFAIIRNIFNGEWMRLTNSFEKYYPKFARKISDMDLQMDALIVLDEDELAELNKLAIPLVGREQKSFAWYYSIKCVYPYIFPIVSLVPAENVKNDTTFALGSHYEKFIKSNSSKRTLIQVAGMNAAGQLRDKYFEYRSMDVSPNQLKDHRKYLDVIKSTFRYDEEFIKKIGRILYNIDDGDVINYGDEAELFYRNRDLNELLDKVAILRENKEIRFDFLELLFECYFKDLQWAYAAKTSNDIYEIRQIIHKENCLRPLTNMNFLDKFKFDINIPEELSKKIIEKEFVDDKIKPVLLKEHYQSINLFGSEEVKFDFSEEDERAELNELKAYKEQVKAEEQRIKNEELESIREAKKIAENARIREREIKVQSARKLKEQEKKLKEKEAEIMKKIEEKKKAAIAWAKEQQKMVSNYPKKRA
ncbi:hypothetical protein SHELI_v1c06200 [Spiroplasma helicoides]|uniref:Uncharacterized protein n=1 Tax=Spiroplasma helicoides TaxID=216938 RepID=A0A1B3SKW2_9MOLU|nr:hypothetical protein [Spiroplasma helicoides]AOG60571.1 hypothetical protein SHELI_v1c06200 [Spiroplasma helicoides]